MKISRRHIYFSFIIGILALFLVTFELPYYVYKPGHTAELDHIVTVEGGYDHAGKMQLVTVSGGQATPMGYFWAKVLKFHDIVPISDARPSGMTDEEYMHGQLHLMESSQQASTVVAYKAAGKDITIDYKGVYVMSIVDGMPANNILEIGDVIVKIDDQQLNESSELISYVETKKAGETIDLEILRNNKIIHEQLELKSFPDDPTKVGIGIQLVTQREVDVDPPVTFESGSIGGPSAGLMFSLEIYNQLTEEDITKGYNLVGTGEIDYDGNVLRIGGVDKKVIAAHKKECDIFFVPNEQGHEDSNYVVAKQIAEQINTPMQIVPVDHFDDVIDYLNKLESK